MVFSFLMNYKNNKKEYDFLIFFFGVRDYLILNGFV